MLVIDDRDQKTDDEQRQLDAGLFDRLLERVADQDHHIEHEKRAQKPDVADVVDGLSGRIIRQADNRIGRRRPAELVTGDEEAGDRTADQARDHEPERRDRRCRLRARWRARTAQR